MSAAHSGRQAAAGMFVGTTPPLAFGDDSRLERHTADDTRAVAAPWKA